MNPYRFVISLRIRHPEWRHETITQALGMNPRLAWSVGSPRVTPADRPLEGCYPETYWTSRLDQAAGDLREALAAQAECLQAHAAFFAELRESGGRAELFVGLFCDSNIGAELDPSLLTVCGELGLALAFDIYPSGSAEAAS